MPDFFAFLLGVLLTIGSGVGDRSNDGTVSYDLGRNGPDKTKITVELKGIVDKGTCTCRDMAGWLLWGDTAAARRIRFRVPVAGFSSAKPEMAKLMTGPEVLDALKHPWIEFESTQIETVPEKQNTYLVTGMLKVHGKERRIQVEGTCTELVNAGFPREKGFVGSMIHMRFATTLRSAEFGIAWPGAAVGAAAKDEVWVEVNTFGFTNDRSNRTREQLDEESFPKPQSAPTSKPSVATGEKG